MLIKVNYISKGEIKIKMYKRSISRAQTFQTTVLNSDKLLEVNIFIQKYSLPKLRHFVHIISQ